MYNLYEEKQEKQKQIKRLSRLISRIDSNIARYERFLTRLRLPVSQQDQTTIKKGLAHMGLTSQNEAMQ